MDETLKKELEAQLKDATDKLKSMAEQGASEAATKAIKTEKENIEKVLGDQSAELQKINDTVIKLGKSIEQLSLSDIGASQKVIEKQMTPQSKAKMWRGMLIGEWAGAETEKSIRDALKAKAVEAGDMSSGGALTSIEFSSDIVKLVREKTKFAELGCMMVNPTRYHFAIPKTVSGTTAYMVGETSTITASDIKFDVINMQPKKIAALAAASREMIDAADPAIVPIIENDLAEAIAQKQMEMFLYGNGGSNQPVGIFNFPGVTFYHPGATGDSPSKDFFRKLRSQVNEKYDDEMMKFLICRGTMNKIASVANTAAADATVMLTDAQVAERMLGASFVRSGLVSHDKTKSTGTYLSDVFYGNWSQTVVAQWFGGLRIEQSKEAGNFFSDDLYGVKAVLPFDVAIRDVGQIAIADYVQTDLTS